MKIEEVIPRYSKYRNTIQDYMSNLLNSISESYGEIPEQFLISLDMLVFNLDILLDAVDNLKENGMTTIDKYRGEKKNTALQSFFNAQTQIHKILNSFGFNPMSKSKIKINNESVDDQKFLESLQDV